MEFLAACHAHSIWSYDGSWELKDLAQGFRARGYRVLLMTEHDRGFTSERLTAYREACRAASSSEMLVVPGIEYSDAANCVHVLVWGPVPFLGEGLPTGEMLEAAHGAGGLAVLAHPSRREAWRKFEPSWATHLLGIERWNRKYDGWAPSTDSPTLLSETRPVEFVGLDFHTKRQFFPLAMALDISREITEDTVLEALRARRCSARAFGVPVSRSLTYQAVSLLYAAEKGRRALASLVRRSRAFAGK